jgi:hypothetical protein
MKCSASDPSRDRLPVEPKSPQLGPGNDPVLSAGKARDPLSPRKWSGIVAFFDTFPYHLASVAMVVLPGGCAV